MVAADGVEGAYLALSQPPRAVVSDLWMPGISGVQVCRLLRAEPATENVPVILRGPEAGGRDRFWAERAGASYVSKGRMGELVRTLAQVIAAAGEASDFFVQLSDASNDVRDRIAAHLDSALFESVVASEVRGLSVCGEFGRMFDLLSQLVSQVATYRWLALSTRDRSGIHCHPSAEEQSCREASEALGCAPSILVQDEDAHCDPSGPAPIVRSICFGEVQIGRLALAPRGRDSMDGALMDVLAREVAGPLQIVSLMEESQRLARIDGLTGLLNRRAFIERLDVEIARNTRHGNPLCVTLLDVDHFKSINDRFGHPTGDAVLSTLGKYLANSARKTDFVGRWGGEEFVIALPETDPSGGGQAADRSRRGVEELRVLDPSGAPIPVTASFGVASVLPNDSVDTLVDRADRALYQAKASGRNRVVHDGVPRPALVVAGE
jgi:two-component system cell cycle response regulator